MVYNNVTLKDGSTLWHRATSPAKVDGAITNFSEAPISVLRGTGRFEGAKDGILSGTRLTPLAQGTKLYLDVLVNVKK